MPAIPFWAVGFALLLFAAIMAVLELAKRWQTGPTEEVEV